MEEQLATIQEAGGDTALLEKQITEEHARRDTLLLERAGHANKEVHLRFLLELTEMLEPITTSSFDGRTRDGCGGRVTVKRTEHEPGACADEDEFFRLTRPRYHEGVIVDGQVVGYDNEMVIRYLDRVVVNDQNYEVQLKGGVIITI